MKNCVIYTRVSTAMQAEVEYNSCEAQRDKILSYVKSQEGLEVYKEYSDPGFTGSNLDRPALKELLNDITQGKIQEVLTYKIDRLTRSSRDFYALIEFFEKHGVSFVSVTERFDTSSPSGRLLRNIMLTFAQFEREMTSERTRDKLLQRAERGMKNGGCTPLGYHSADKKLFVNKDKAKIVREIFEEFIATGSLIKAWQIAKKHDLRGPRTGKPFSICGVAEILRNPVYTGQVLWNKKTYPGQHEAIISKDLFEEAQKMTKEKVIKKKLNKEYLVAGLIHCSDCGSRMNPSHANKPKRRYYYYRCYRVVKEGKHSCNIREVNAERLETLLIENLSRISKDSQYIQSLAFKLAYETPGRSRIEPSSEDVKNIEACVQQVLMDFKNGLQDKTQIEKCLILRKRIERLTYRKDSLEVLISLRDTSPVLVESNFQAESGKMAARIREGRPNLPNPAWKLSSTGKNGAEGQNRTAHACLFRAALYH